jgi:hypothetical protein
VRTNRRTLPSLCEASGDDNSALAVAPRGESPS